MGAAGSLPPGRQRPARPGLARHPARHPVGHRRADHSGAVRRAGSGRAGRASAAGRRRRRRAGAAAPGQAPADPGRHRGAPVGRRRCPAGLGRTQRHPAGDRLDPRPDRLRPPAVRRPSRHHRHAGRQFLPAERRLRAGARLAPEHPPDQLQLGQLRRRRFRGPGRHRPARTAQAHGQARPGHRGRRRPVPGGPGQPAGQRRAALVQRLGRLVPGDRPDLPGARRTPPP